MFDHRGGHRPGRSAGLAVDEDLGGRVAAATHDTSAPAFTSAPLRAGSLAAMTTTENIPPDDVVEPDDAGTEGHDVPADLLELHGLLELELNNGGPA